MSAGTPPEPPSDPPSDPQDEELYRTLRELAGVELAAVTVRHPAASHRPTMTAVEADEQGGDTTLHVHLMLHERGISGSAKGPANVPAINRSAAEATLHALDELVLSGYALARIDWLEILEPPGPDMPRVMHVAVLFRTAEREDLLVGSSIVRGVEYEAAVRATLDAVNRQVELLVQARTDG